MRTVLRCFGSVLMLPFAVGLPAAAEPLQTTLPPAQILKPGGDVSYPKLVEKVTPIYTREAMRAGVQGEVHLEAVIREDGTVGDLRVTRSLDTQFGLDEAALRAAAGWRFEPARRAGTPVPVRVTLVLEFRMAGQPRPNPQVTAEDAEFLQGAQLAGTEGVVAPTLRQTVQPKYTANAMRAKLQGTVTVQVVVMPDGTVARARVVESLDTQLGLDDEALRAAMQWTYEPGSGTFDGQPAPVAVTIVLEFGIH